ncbi:VanZ family protein [Clostridium sp. Marseille-P299]|uniref:VanZ family protein n=1 Tax=Clostridium sp. Marseille-P299 TaxID=1805477 RepID=UPI0008353638|nr:VanZ family protein [Clostridium sp. Marseille-P299]
MKKKIYNTMFYTSFIFYIWFLIRNILFKYVSPLELFRDGRYFSRTLNMRPLYNIFGTYFNKLDFYGNIVLFIPFGIYLGLMARNISRAKKIAMFTLLSLFFETFQYVFGIGASDISDVITNTIGGIIGLCIYKIFKKFLKDDTKVKNLVAVCSSAVLIPVVFILVALKIHN